MATQPYRTVQRVIAAKQMMQGTLLVHRSFPDRTLLDLDPFLLLDEMGPLVTQPNEAAGVPEHPHRGFETVTYLLDGCMQHKDSFGHEGQLKAGDMQWMTAGSGIVHSELPEAEFVKKGGRLHGFQLWINLPQRDKMVAPGYQEIKADLIPKVSSQDGLIKVVVIAGEAFGQKAALTTRIPLFYLHATVQPGGVWQYPTDQKYNVFAYTISGKGNFGKSASGKQKMGEDHLLMLYNNDGDAIEISAPIESTAPLEVLLIGGLPLNEPIVRYGPFVMNTEEEIRQAFIDYHTGRMGNIRF